MSSGELCHAVMRTGVRCDCAHHLCPHHFLTIYICCVVQSEEMKSKDQRRPYHSLKKRFHDDTQDSLYTHEIFIEV